jgi:acyl-coenzyme A thioesterase PaaI-like protein
MKASLLRRVINLWPPLLCSGIAISRLSADYRSAEVVLRRRWYNRKRGQAHFGGSLFAMTDIAYALMIGLVLGRGYVVWDKSAAIEFVSPGIGTVTARFHLTDEVVARIYRETEGGGKYLPAFPVEVVDAKGNLVARVERTIYVRKRVSTAASQARAAALESS